MINAIKGPGFRGLKVEDSSHMQHALTIIQGRQEFDRLEEICDTLDKIGDLDVALSADFSTDLLISLTDKHGNCSGEKYIVDGPAEYITKLEEAEKTALNWNTIVRKKQAEAEKQRKLEEEKARQSALARQQIDNFLQKYANLADSKTREFEEQKIHTIDPKPEISTARNCRKPSRWKSRKEKAA